LEVVYVVGGGVLDIAKPQRGSVEGEGNDLAWQTFDISTFCDQKNVD